MHSCPAHRSHKRLARGARCALYLLAGVVSALSTAAAADIQLTLSHRSINDQVTLWIENGSAAAVQIDAAYITLDQKRYEGATRIEIPSRRKKELHFQVQYPALPGSYPLAATVRYVNDGRLLSLRHVGLFSYQAPAPLKGGAAIDTAAFEVEGDIILRSSEPGLWRLIMPEELELVRDDVLEGRRVFRVRTTAPGIRCTYPVFGVAEQIRAGKHFAGLQAATVYVGQSTAAPAKRGAVPSGALLLQLLFFLGVAWYLTMLRPAGTRAAAALCKYAARIFFLTGFYLCLRHADTWLEALRAVVLWSPLQGLLTIGIDNLRGSNYDYFFRYVVDWYWGACLLLTWPYLYWFDAAAPPAKDKYVCFFKTLASLPSMARGKKPCWSYESRLGMLTIAVKAFFIPYLTSWVINNTFHQRNLASSFHGDLYTINAFLVALFIYIDTAIYAFGYLVELSFLKNRIRSVEPTVLGWLVCLWCYPPFNVFSFKIFDHQLFSLGHTYPAWVNALMTCLISLLWGVFAWASVALGFKASNLTNRGIVSAGPYRFVRHPAYAAKVAIWLIEGIFFAKYGIGILLGFILIYFLRAWTEERHLALDPDYRAYRKQVRWWFIPRLL